MWTKILLSHDQGKKHLFYFISKPVIYHSFYSIYSHDIFNITDPSRVQDRRNFFVINEFCSSTFSTCTYQWYDSRARKFLRGQPGFFGSVHGSANPTMNCTFNNNNNSSLSKKLNLSSFIGINLFEIAQILL